MVVALCSRALAGDWKRVLEQTGWTLRWIDLTKTVSADVTLPALHVAMHLLDATTDTELMAELATRKARFDQDKHSVVVLGRMPASLLQRCAYDVNPDLVALDAADDGVAILRALADTAAQEIPTEQQTAADALQEVLGASIHAAESLADLAARYEAHVLPHNIQQALRPLFG